MGFAAKLYQYDPAIKAVLLPLWTFTPVDDDEGSAEGDKTKV